MTKCSTEGKGWVAWMYTDWRCVMVMLLVLLLVLLVLGFVLNVEDTSISCFRG